MKIVKIIVFSIGLLLTNIAIKAQAYHATHGSPYAGAVSIFNNPASSVNSAYKWDLNLFSFQSTVATNHLSLADFSYTNPGNTYLSFADGSNSHYVHQNTDLNLFSFQYKLDDKHAFTVAFRGRMYNHSKTSPIFGSDTIGSLYSFLKANRTTPYLEAFATHSGWLEMNLNYAQVLYESSNQKLTGGINLNFTKGLSGFYGKLNKLSFSEFTAGADTGYTLINGGFAYAYSNNYDNTSATANSAAKDFLKNTLNSVGISLGLEYTLYNNLNKESLSNNPINYDWKFGFSIMDLGKNRYKASEYGGNFSQPTTQITDAVIGDKFSNVIAMDEFRDSLKTIFNSYEAITGNFNISTPTRIILNVDKNLGNNFALNGELNLNLFSTANYNKLLTRELNLVTLTPRWETIAWGVYLPVQYTSQGNIWVGAAVKLGPLTLGLHDISWVKKINTINGGGYILLSIHPFNKRKIISRFDCPE